MNKYRYYDCGLDNVFIEGVSFVKADDGEDVVRIPNINALHKAIALGIVIRKSMMNGSELRFLRTELGMTQAELAELIHRESLAVSRWERGENPIDPNAETIVRMLAIEKLSLNVEHDIKVISGWSIECAVPQPIVIDGSDPSNYHLAA